MAKWGLIAPDAPLLPARPLSLSKRAEWFLEELLHAGSEGTTTINYPGVRVSDCIFKLRQAGVNVETVYESHDGTFAGRHGRFFLKSRVVLLADDMQEAA